MMEMTYEKVSAWFDKYFKIVSKTADTKSVPKLGKFFSDDFEFIYYTLPKGADFTSEKSNREGLLMMFMHPGIYEVIKPEYYVIDLQQMIISVKFYDQLVNETADVMGHFHASAIYHVIPADDTGLKIRKIEYWTENQSPESIELQTKAWIKASREAFNSVISDWLKSNY